MDDEPLECAWCETVYEPLDPRASDPSEDGWWIRLGPDGAQLAWCSWDCLISWA